MARAGITKSEVFEVADLLRSEGVDASPGTVRERTGTGSYSTIKRYLDEWRDANPTPAPTVPEMPEAVQHAARQIWAVAAKEAKERMRAERAVLDAERQHFDRQRSELEHEIARLEQVTADLQSQVDDANKRAGELQDALAEFDAKTATLTERGIQWRERAERAEDQVEKLQAQLAELARGN